MYSIVDIESNGGKYREECIIDIAIFRFDGHQITDQFMSLVNPEAEITPYVQKLTGISSKMVKTAPKFHEIARRVVEITEGTTLVGHNIDFDYRMLRQSFKRLGYDYKINTLDTIPIAKKLIPEAESYSLGRLVKSLGIPLLDAHRAAGDARATVELFKVLMDKDNNSEIIQQQFEETNSKTYINRVKELTQDLPNEKGIVYFQNDQGTILFSDFVLDVNKAAKKAFNSKSVRWKPVQETCSKVSFELSGNDLIAKLMMKARGIRRQEKYPFGLYRQKGKYFAEKNSLHPEEKPLLKFRSFTQARKAVSFITSQPELDDVQILLDRISLKKRNEIWTTTGRKRGEKSFLTLKNGKISGFGFYEYHSQIATPEKISKLQTVFDPPLGELQNDLRLSLLKGDFEIQQLPEK
ncbi:3'-5' exonuclease [Daejeonia sp. YH14]|uniref:3'-5' exonuclease n=1 Tax=Daejeonia sp. YH14 TaxID=3439042 RepID=UPI003F497B92